MEFSVLAARPSSCSSKRSRDELQTVDVERLGSMPVLVVALGRLGAQHLGEELRQAIEAIEAQAAARLDVLDSAAGRLVAEVAVGELYDEGARWRQPAAARRIIRHVRVRSAPAAGSLNGTSTIL